MENLFELLDRRSGVADAPGAQPLALTAGEVEFKNVVFEYERGAPVLRGLSFRAEGGRTIAVRCCLPLFFGRCRWGFRRVPFAACQTPAPPAPPAPHSPPPPLPALLPNNGLKTQFVGATGSGKSTLTRLLFRFYDATSGVVAVDGQDVRSLDQASLRAAVGLVPQDCVLFNDTARAARRARSLADRAGFAFFRRGEGGQRCAASGGARCTRAASPSRVSRR